MKYFANILNPFAPLLTKKLEEIGKLNLPIDIIATSHGAIWRDDPLQIVKKYAEWANAYQENQITIAYDTMWEGTTKIAHEIAAEISKQSPATVVKVFNVAKADKNEVMTEVFKSKAMRVSATVFYRVLQAGLNLRNNKKATAGFAGKTQRCRL